MNGICEVMACPPSTGVVAVTSESLNSPTNNDGPRPQTLDGFCAAGGQGGV